ncbi:epoxide hydrolase family protein [Mucilaginibacter sp.]|uniref:epoxide hydrolase family protein n=1 Tax=Mucilaginibacter sp. TaxID=1882438 RepID=UPI0025DF5F4A|nr:epoxide hydrolase family protein [Mucilaginibacter sp.]
METSTATLEEVGSGELIRPFRFNFPQADLDDLHRRILATRWSEKETVDDFSQGTPLATLQTLAGYWASNYDWRKIEAKINALPQFITSIDGLDIHFIHVRSKNPNALPIIITHGWPASITHQMKIIGPLTDPEVFGGMTEEAFDVVFPSMPGYGFSGKPTSTGWGPERIAKAWVVLMKRLGYNKFVAQGGDWGALITEQMAVQAAPELIGIHTNMPGAVPAELNEAAFTGVPTPSWLSGEEKQAYEQLVFVYQHVYYASYMASRPQALAALADSPVGMAAFLIDFDARGLDLISRAFAGQNESLTRDEILDNITLFWLTNTAVSAARLYRENKLAYFSPKGITIPVAVSVFPDELFVAPHSWVEKAYPNLIHYNKLDKGGHFPAWEQPTLFVNEMRAAFSSLR